MKMETKSNSHKKGLLPCAQCEYKTGRQSNLNMYKENHIKYTCKECEFSGSSRKKLMKHKRKVPTERKPEDCELPRRSNCLNGDLQKFDKCEYKTAKCYNMRVQGRREKRKKKEGKGGKKVEKRSRKLEREKEKKLKEEKRETRKRKKDKKCNECEFSSIKSINLKRHKRIHHGEMRNDAECATSAAIQI